MTGDWRAFALLLAWGLTGCAGASASGTPPAPIGTSSEDLPPIPVCRDEMRAFVELTRLAKLHGEGWTVFAPAVDAMRRQILDCLDENIGQMTAL